MNYVKGHRRFPVLNHRTGWWVRLAYRLGVPIPSDPNPFPRFRLFRWLP